MILSLALAFCLLCMALLVYPGELTHVGTGANRWLYNRGAAKYQEKWCSRAYTDKRYQRSIIGAVRAGLDGSGCHRILDLGCGTGHGLKLLAGSDIGDLAYTGVDYSHGMLREFSSWLAGPGAEWADCSRLVNDELSVWSGCAEDSAYGAVMMLEVGEFLPDFVAVLGAAAGAIAPGGALVMTRPARLWWLCFPGRAQSRRSLSRAIRGAGLSSPVFIPWRGRYEIVIARRQSNPPSLSRRFTRNESVPTSAAR